MHTRHQSLRSRPLTLEQLEDRNLLSFLPAVNYDVGDGPWTVTVADLTGHGISDLVVPSQHGNVGTVDILLGNGDGTFQPAVSYRAGSSAFQAAVGDFDRDGTLDLAVVDAGANVSILLGNGDGSFQAPVSYPAGPAPITVLAADLNGDGILDLAVANETSNTVSILRGNGDGTFQAAQSYPTDTHILNWMALGDFDGDGSPDLVCANYGVNTVNVLLGNGDGSFQAPVSYTAGPAGSFPYAVSVGEFDGDRALDLAVPNQNGLSEGMVSILRGNGDGSFQAPVSYPTGDQGPISVAVADYNRNGIADLAVVNDGSGGNGNVGVLLGNGDGSFQASTTYTVGPAPRFLAAGDFNGDGFPDLAVPNTNGGNPGSVSVLINAADWSGGPPGAPPSAGEPRIDPLTAQLAVTPPQGVFPTNVNSTVPASLALASPIPVSEEAPLEQTSQAEASPVPLLNAMGRQARDTAFEGRIDPVDAMLTSNLFAS
jgi:hypothetical protein